MNTFYKNILSLIALTLIISLLNHSCTSDETNKENSSNEKIPLHSGVTNQAIDIDSLISEELKKSYQLGAKEKKHKKAITLLELVLSNPAFSIAQDSSRGALFHRLGAYHLNLRSFDSALVYLDQAVTIRSSCETCSKLDLAHTYYARSLTYNFLRQRKNTLSDLKEAIYLLEDHDKDNPELEKYYLLIADTYNELKDPSNADIYYQKVQNKYDQLTSFKSAENASGLNLFGNRYRKRREYKKALEAFQIAVSMYDDLGLIYNAIQTEVNIGIVYYNKKNYSKAGASWKSTLSKINKNKNQNVDLSLLKHDCLNNLAMNEITTKNYQEAKLYYSQLLAHVETKNQTHSVGLARALEGLGDVDYETTKYQESISNYHKSIQALCLGYNDSNIYSAPSIERLEVLNMDELMRILGFKLVAMEAEYKATKNLEILEALNDNYKALDEIVFYIRQSYDNTTSRYRLVAASLSKYERAIQVALDLYEKKNDEKYLLDAYHFSSKNKAIILLDGLQDEDAKFEGIPAKLLKEEQKLKHEFYQIQTKIYDLSQESNQQAIDDAKEIRFELYRKYDRLINQFESDYPKYFELKYAHKTLPSPTKMANELPENTAIIEYFVGAKKIYIFTISKDEKLSYFIQDRPEDFNKKCIDFTSSLDEGLADNNAQLGESSFEFYKLLLEKPLEALNAKEEVKRLIVVPDGPLLQLPFDALFNEMPKSDWSWSSPDLPYLGAEIAFSYAYSNRLIFDSDKSKRIKTSLKSFRGFGLTYADSLSLAGFSDLEKLEVDTIISRGMGKLIYSVPEVKEIAKITKGKAFTDDLATKAKFIKEAPKAKILHLAMHGFIVKDKPLNSGLIFSRKDNLNNYILKASELYSLPLKADLVVLSACHTGAGTIEAGEGVRTMARAFNYAGCPSVVASLWGAPDFSTKEIMVSFYQYLKEGFPKDVALQKAKNDFMQNAPGAFIGAGHWAHLIVIGDVRAFD